ncbi:uncharacterized protein [Rutidosis leptorrhynchoides]|uniref:uncharacterized protein n=1 Tax=Rutidosis leptorrhynchoides TaxID=125765 RepID=UPI003A9A3184
MVDTRPVMEQFHELLRILGQFVQHNLKMDEAISVVMIIDKLPPSWKEFKHTLKHSKEEITLIQLGSHFRIEEALNSQELDNNPKGKNQVGNSSVNMVEGESSKNFNKFNNNKRKNKGGDDKSGRFKKSKLECWKCDKPGHIQNYISMISDAFYVQDDDVAWWVDSGATCLVCKDLRWFEECQPIEDGSCVKMGNVATEPIKGIGRVLLNFTSGNVL